VDLYSALSLSGNGEYNSWVGWPSNPTHKLYSPFPDSREHTCTPNYLALSYYTAIVCHCN